MALSETSSMVALRIWSLFVRGCFSWLTKNSSSSPRYKILMRYISRFRWDTTCPDSESMQNLRLIGCFSVHKNIFSSSKFELGEKHAFDVQLFRVAVHEIWQPPWSPPYSKVPALIISKGFVWFSLLHTLLVVIVRIKMSNGLDLMWIVVFDWCVDENDASTTERGKRAWS